MTSLSGEFQTDLPIHDAIVPCTEAISSLGWHVETVEANRIVSYTDSDPEDRAKIEIDLAKSDQGTDIRITGTDSDVNPLHRDELIEELNKARDAVERFLGEAEEEQSGEEEQQGEGDQPQEESAGEEQEVDSNPQAAAGWYPDVYDEGRERYWDGEEWTDEFRPTESASKPEPKPARGGRKERRAEKRRLSRERAEERRRLRDEDRRAKEAESPVPYDAEEGAAEPQQEPASATPAKFRSLRLIADIYGFLGWLVAIGGPVVTVAVAAGGDGDAGSTLALGLVGSAFYALLLFGVAAAIRLALAVEENTRATVELLKAQQ